MVRTVTTREPEWDDWERAKMQALTEYERGICECGMHESIADADPDLEMVERVCPVCANLARNMRVDQAAMRAENKRRYGDNPAPSAELVDDGRHVGVRRKAPSIADVDVAQQ